MNSCLAACVLSGSWALPIPSQEPPPVEERRLATLQPDVVPKDLRFLPSGRTVCYVGTCNGRSAFYVNDSKGEEFDRIMLNSVSDDGRRFVCTAGFGGEQSKEGVYSKGKWVVVTDSWKSPAFDSITSLALTPDGKHVAFSGLTGGPGASSRVFLDQIQGDEHRQAYRVGIAPDGSDVVYETYDQDTNQRFVIAGIRPGSKKIAGENPAIGPDGKSLAYVSGPHGKQCVVLGEKSSEPYETIVHLSFRPGVGTVVYMAHKASKWYLADGDKTHGPYDKVSWPTFTSDGKHMAYATKTGDHQWKLLVDDREIGSVAADEMILGRLTEDGLRAAAIRVKGGMAAVYTGDALGPEYNAVTDIAFVPGEKSVAYRAFKGTRQLVVIKGEAGESFDAVRAPQVSADGKHVAYAGFKYGKWFVVVDHKRLDEFDDVATVVFNREGTAVACGVRIGRELWWKILSLK